MLSNVFVAVSLNKLPVIWDAMTNIGRHYNWKAKPNLYHEKYPIAAKISINETTAPMIYFPEICVLFQPSISYLNRHRFIFIDVVTSKDHIAKLNVVQIKR